MILPYKTKFIKIMAIYRLKRFSNYYLERRFYDDSEKKKDSGFSWGKALGATALAAGTMYGAKKGAFGNTVRRGFNTAYGQLGNSLGSQSMVNSAARDWAKGSVKSPGMFGNKMQYKRDLVTKQNEFKSQFNKPTTNTTGNNSSGGSTSTTSTSTAQASDSVSPFLTGTGFNNTNNSKPNFDNLLGNGNKGTVIQPAQPSVMSSSVTSQKVEVKPEVAAPKLPAPAVPTAPMAPAAPTQPQVRLKDLPNVGPKKKVEVFGTGNNEGQRQRLIKEYNTREQQRIEAGRQSSGFHGEKKTRTKISAAEQQARKDRQRAEIQANTAKNQQKRVDRRKASVETAIQNQEQRAMNDFYNDPNYGYMMNQVSFSNTRILKNQRFFSEKEDSSRKKKIRNAALLGVGAAGIGALTIYGIKKGKNSRKNIKELEKTVKQNNQKINELRKERESVLTNLKKSEKELGELRKKAKDLANGEYKYSQKEIDEFMKNMEDPNYILEL